MQAWRVLLLMSVLSACSGSGAERSESDSGSTRDAGPSGDAGSELEGGTNPVDFDATTGKIDGSAPGHGLSPADLPKRNYLAVDGIKPCVITPTDSLKCLATLAVRDEQPGPFRMVSVYNDRVCALDLEGLPRCWKSIGTLEAPALGPLRDIQAEVLPVSITEAGAAVHWGEGGTPAETSYGSGVVDIDGPRGGECYLFEDGHAELRAQGTKRKEMSGPFVQVAGGQGHCCALTPEGDVQCMAETLTNGDFPPDEKFVQIAAGFRFACGIRSDQGISCWGSNPGLPNDSPPKEGKFVEIAAADSAACAVREDGVVLCWGNTDYVPEPGFEAKVAP